MSFSSTALRITFGRVWRVTASRSSIHTCKRLWSCGTFGRRIAGPPVAFEPPSASFVLDWHVFVDIREHRAAFATITHAAGISSTGDEDLDRLLPFDEPYHIPIATAKAVENTRRRGGRVIAVGTTVVRALEDAAIEDGHLRSGDGVAKGKIGPATRLRVVDAILSGTHEPGTKSLRTPPCISRRLNPRTRHL